MNKSPSSLPPGAAPIAGAHPAPAAATAVATAPQEGLVYAVRHYVHFDNLAETLNKQVANVRNMRSKFENEILTMLETQGMKNAVLQISGATLQRQTRHQSTNLSWSFLEEQLHEYYKSKGKPDETAGILDFVQKHRGSRTVDYLKKTSAGSGASPSGSK